MGTIPDGYERQGEHGLVLVDPDTCPAGHPFRFGQRGSPTLCSHRDHRPHNTWICACGQWIWRVPGAFVGQLDCAQQPSASR